jgi:hypothetical protein
MLRKKIFLLVLFATLLMPSAVMRGQELRGQKAHLNPDVVTIWHKLGMPQSLARTKLLKDSFVNRNGLKPGKERKPKLLRIADPANLEEGKPEMLKVAAKMKIDQDLAPQKIKALKYISSVGCSCYNKQSEGAVEAALMEGMKDCTVDVRIAAIQVVLDNAGCQCSCSGQGQCETCCSPGVLKLLEEIAYKMNDNGCYVEPNQQVRCLAAQALLACPPLPWEPPTEEADKPKTAVPDPDLIDTGESNSEEADAELKDQGEQGGAGGDSAANDDDTTRNPTQGNFQQVSQRTSYGGAWSNPELTELEIHGVIVSLRTDRSQVLVKMVKSFELPVGYQLVIAADQNQVSFGTVVSTNAGQVWVQVDDYQVAQQLSNSQRVCLGVLSPVSH